MKSRVYKIDFIKKREKEFNIIKELRPDNITFPKNALIEVSSFCNHACVFCGNPQMSRKTGRLDINIFKSFCIQAKKLGLEEMGFYTTGEPFIVKNLKDYVLIANESGIDYLYLTTNGSLATLDRVKELIDSGLKSIKYSVNATNRETYKQIHKKDDFDKVMKNIRDVRKYVINNNIDLRMMSSLCVTSQTENEIDEFKEMMNDLVDDYKIHGVSTQKGNSTDFVFGNFDDLKSSYSPEYPKMGTAEPCHYLWNRVHLTQEGYLTLCCLDFENLLAYSDLRTELLKDAWNNTVITEMRKKHLNKNIDGTLCHNCLYGKKDVVKAIS